MCSVYSCKGFLRRSVLHTELEERKGYLGLCIIYLLEITVMVLSGLLTKSSIKVESNDGLWCLGYECELEGE